MSKPILYFLCTGNSCRSQMAEGFGRHYLGDTCDVYSAGIEAHGIHPKAVEAMQEVGIDIRSQTSDTIDPDLLQRADVVITLCGHANDVCPSTPTDKERYHWGVADPAKAEGTEAEKWPVFQQVRDEIRERMHTFTDERKKRE